MAVSQPGRRYGRSVTQPEPTPPPASSRGQAAGDDPAPSALDELGSLDVDGVAAATWGTVIWSVALVGTLLMRDRLAASDAQWWIAVCAVAAVGGLVGRWYAVRRREAYRRRAAEGGATATPAPGAAA